MRALQLKGTRIGYSEDVPEPVPRDGEVIVQVVRAGICETDLQLIQGYMGFQGILGHEFVGIAGSGQFEGKRVVGEINNDCGTCEYCTNGLGNHCPNRTVLGILNHDGAFADYVAVPEKNLHPVPDEVTDQEAVFTEPLAAAFEIPRQFELKPEMKVIVLGDGRLGNLCAQVINLSGCHLLVAGKHENKMDLIRKAGIEARQVEELQEPSVADVVVDCTGSPSGIQKSLHLVKPRGTVILKTTVAGTQEISLAPFVIDEINLIGSRCGPFPDALDALKNHRVQLEGLLSATYPFHDVVNAFDQAQAEGVLKVQLDMVNH